MSDTEIEYSIDDAPMTDDEIMGYMKRIGIDYCFPTVCERDNLAFSELKEFVMCMEQRVNAVGNTCNIHDKMLVIITGANQGGKSTFLRSVGIAQVMMQAGLQVAAESFSSGILFLMPLSIFESAMQMRLFFPKRSSISCSASIKAFSGE